MTRDNGAITDKRAAVSLMQHAESRLLTRALLARTVEERRDTTGAANILRNAWLVLVREIRSEKIGEPSRERSSRDD